MAQNAEAIVVRYREEDRQMNQGQIKRGQAQVIRMDGGQGNRRPADRSRMQQRRVDAEQINRRPVDRNRVQQRRVDAEQINRRPVDRNRVQQRRVDAEQINRRPADGSRVQQRRVDAEQGNRRPADGSRTQQRRMSREQAMRIKARRKREAQIRRRKQILGVMCAAVLVLIGYNFFNGFSGKATESDIQENNILENNVMDTNTSDVVAKVETSRIVGNASDVSHTVPKIYEGSDLEAELLRQAQSSEEFRQIYDKRTEYPDILLQALCSNPEMMDYVLGFPDAEKAAEGGLTEEEKSASFPLLMQWDKRWGYAVYGESYIGLSGCAPTCLAMVVKALTNQNDVTPATVAEYAQREGYYVTGTGTAWSLMTEGATHFGVSGWEISLSEETVFGYLRAGNPIICSMRPGDFTTQGHFIVLVGVEDGKIIVNDPNSQERSNLLWDYDTLAGQIKNLWAFE